MEACVAKGVKAVVMFTAGFAEIGPEGRVMQERIIEIGPWRRHQAVRAELPRPLQHARRPYPDLQLVPRGGSDAGRSARHGDAIGRVRDASIGIDRAPRHPGRGVAQHGNEADVSVADGISFLADDPDTTAIACYVEQIKDGAQFAAAVARARANGKPVIAMKVGGSEIGAAAAARTPLPSPAATRSMTRHCASSASSAPNPGGFGRESPMPAPAVGCRARGASRS